jgi:hypothetical protein
MMRVPDLPFVAVAIMVLLALPVCAQPPLDIRQGNIDYPVPLPAGLAALLSEEDPLFMEPSTVRNATVAMQGVRMGEATHVALGGEFAPFLIGSGVNLSDYLSGRLIRVLLRTRISFAVDLSEGTGFHSALGLRWMLHDDADLRADSLLLRALHGWEEGRWGTEPGFDSLRAAFRELYWNRSVVEIAVAGAFRGRVGGNGTMALVARQYHGFLSAGFPAFGTSGQIQFGASGWTGFTPGESAYQRQGSLTLRLFYGTASERLFAGTRLVAGSLDIPDYRVELGGLVGVGNGFWLRPDLGASLLRHPSRGAEAGITLSFGTPELRRPAR